MRSVSPSKAIPRSAPCRRTAAMRGFKFSSTVGSGWRFGKRPTISKNNSVAWQLSFSSRRCITGPPVPLPASMTTLMRRAKWNCAAISLTYGSATSTVCSLPAPVRKIAPLDQPPDLLDLFAMNRGRPAHDLETVVLGRIVAAGDHDGCGGLQVEHGIVEQGSRRHTDIRDLTAASLQAAQQCIAQT